MSQLRLSSRTGTSSRADATQNQGLHRGFSPPNTDSFLPVLEGPGLQIQSITKMFPEEMGSCTFASCTDGSVGP